MPVHLDMPLPTEIEAVIDYIRKYDLLNEGYMKSRISASTILDTPLFPAFGISSEINIWVTLNNLRDKINENIYGTPLYEVMSILTYNAQAVFNPERRTKFKILIFWRTLIYSPPSLFHRRKKQKQQTSNCKY